MKLCIVMLLCLGAAYLSVAQLNNYWVVGPCPDDEVKRGCPLSPNAKCSFICWNVTDSTNPVECMFQHFLNGERVGCWAK
ncbi:metallocarboxypeptidase inhibitor b-like [Pomacea canaliculata]|uniref:metallocarboxypeptidase inhibitor b-like n=1 Tax=Pomacea canaliculata TaxID=400727 RepID=UPI000D736FA5|nr:metallocarboxypeptidase inhibitor b-like [Pomacea canaliculata]